MQSLRLAAAGCETATEIKLCGAKIMNRLKSTFFLFDEEEREYCYQ